MKKRRPRRLSPVAKKSAADSAFLQAEEPGKAARLKAGSADSPAEKQADRMADRAISSGESKIQRQPEEEQAQAKMEETIHRQEEEEAMSKKEMPEEEEEKVSRKEEAEEEEEVMSKKESPEEEEEKASRQPVSPAAPKVASPWVSRKVKEKTGGSPLPDAPRKNLEKRFGADLSRVRVHTDMQAEKMSAGLNAQAFTVGEHIYFNKARFNPSMLQGKKLLAHELVHTMQQKGKKKK